MNRLVDVFHILLISLALSPVYFIWQSNRVNEFCSHVESGMTVNTLNELADRAGLKVVGLANANTNFGKWQASVVTKLPFSDDECRVKGLGSNVARAKFIDK